MAKSKIIIVAIIVICSAVALFSFKGLLTPYVPFDDAKNNPDYVQIIGRLVKTVPMQNTTDGFLFVIEDKALERMTVLYRGAKPLNFEHATSVVAIGIYNNKKQMFEADKILVKCPSKYTREQK